MISQKSFLFVLSLFFLSVFSHGAEVHEENAVCDICHSSEGVLEEIFDGTGALSFHASCAKRNSFLRTRDFCLANGGVQFHISLRMLEEYGESAELSSFAWLASQVYLKEDMVFCAFQCLQKYGVPFERTTPFEGSGRWNALEKLLDEMIERGLAEEFLLDSLKDSRTESPVFYPRHKKNRGPSVIVDLALIYFVKSLRKVSSKENFEEIKQRYSRFFDVDSLITEYEILLGQT